MRALLLLPFLAVAAAAQHDSVTVIDNQGMSPVPEGRYTCWGSGRFAREAWTKHGAKFERRNWDEADRARPWREIVLYGEFGHVGDPRFEAHLVSNHPLSPPSRTGPGDLERRAAMDEIVAACERHRAAENAKKTALIVGAPILALIGFLMGFFRRWYEDEATADIFPLAARISRWLGGLAALGLIGYALWLGKRGHLPPESVVLAIALAVVTLGGLLACYATRPLIYVGIRLFRKPS